MDKNTWTDWEAIVKVPFGSASSISGALMTNPSAFLKHTAFNSVELFHTIFGVFFMHFNICLPVRTGAKFVAEAYMLCALLIGAGVYYRRLLIQRFRERFQESKLIILFSSIVCLPCLISLIIIYPRYHYALIVGVVIAFVAAVVFAPRGDHIQKNTALFYALLFVMLTPYSCPNPYFSYSSNSGQLPNVDTIRFIEAMHISKPVHMLEAEGGIAYYLSRNYTWVADWTKTTDFYQFLNDNGINMIVLSDALYSDSRFSGDSQWHAYLLNPRKFGFINLDIGGTKRQLLVHEALIK
ncbi:MAG: hypothetical protein HQK97_10485 [Nitrospirae bacterium]|nr:hypothetical protein [Nitrospirota bacterium]